MILLLNVDWFGGDGLKIAIFAGFMAVFYGLARWASAATEKSTESHADAMFPDGQQSDVPQYHPPQYLVDTHDAESRAEAPRHPGMRYGDVELLDLNFKTFEAMVGPPNPECFCDEIMLDLYNVAHGHRYSMTYVVATPDGLRKALDDKQWDIMCLPAVYVVRRYDLAVIRDTILGEQDEGEEELDPTRQVEVDPLKRIPGGY